MLTTPDELMRDGGKMSKTGTTTYDTIVGKLSDFVSNASTYTPSQIIFKVIEIRQLIRKWNSKHNIKSMFQTPRYRALKKLYNEARYVMGMFSQSRKRKNKLSIYDDEGVTLGQNNVVPLVGGPGKSGVDQLDDLMDMDMVVTSGQTNGDEFEVIREEDKIEEPGSTPMGISLKEFMDDHMSQTPGNDDTDVDFL